MAISDLEQRVSAGDSKALPAVVVNRTHPMEVTAGDLKALIAKRPDHPCCKAFNKNFDPPKDKPYLDNHIFIVDRADLEGAISGNDVVEKIVEENGKHYRVKVCDKPATPKPKAVRRTSEPSE